MEEIVDTVSSFELKDSLYNLSTLVVFQPSQGLIQIV